MPRRWFAPLAMLLAVVLMLATAPTSLAQEATPEETTAVTPEPTAPAATEVPPTEPVETEIPPTEAPPTEIPATETPTATTEPTGESTATATATASPTGTPEEEPEFSAAAAPVASFDQATYTSPAGGSFTAVLSINMSEPTSGNVTLSAPAYANIANASSSIPLGTCTIGSQTETSLSVSFANPDLVARTCVVTITLDVHPGAPPLTSWPMTANGVTSQPPGGTVTASATFTVAPGQSAGISIDVSDAGPAPGESIAVTIRQNESGVPILPIGSITGSVPAGTTLVPASSVVICQGGGCTPHPATEAPPLVTGTYTPLPVPVPPYTVTLTYHVTIDPTVTPGTVISFIGYGTTSAGTLTALVTANVTVSEALVANDLSLDVSYGQSRDGTLTATGGVAPLAFYLNTLPQKGDAFVSPDGSGTFTYVPDPGETGTDSFTFRVEDAADPMNTAYGTVSITIGDPLTATGTTLTVPFEGSGNGTVTASGGIAPVTFTFQTAPTKGTVALNADGTFTYTADPGETGADQFIIVATDSGTPALTATATVDVIIGAPDALVAQTLTIDADAGETITGNLAPQVSGGIPPYTFSLATNATQGNVTIDPSGAFSYTANADASGADSFTYTVTDSAPEGVAAAATVTGTVNVVIAAAPASPTPSPTATLEPGITPTATVEPGNTPTATVEPGVTPTPTDDGGIVGPGNPETATPTDPPAGDDDAAGDGDGAGDDDGGAPVTRLPSTGQGASASATSPLAIGLMFAGLALLAGSGLIASRRAR